MAKKKSKSRQAKQTKTRQSAEEEERLTLEAIDAMSSDDEDGGPSDTAGGNEWNAEAMALRQAISEGAFDHLLKMKDDEDEDEDIEVLEASDDDAEEQDDNSDDQEQEAIEDQDDDAVEETREPDPREQSDSEKSEEEMEDDEDSEAEAERKAILNSGKALLTTTQELVSAKQGMPWAETFDIIPDQSLPFGAVGAEGSPLDVHDDLKRELAFYNLALEAVNEARSKCQQAGVPFSRPEDFFAEMVKTDDHMAKVKDRLIFETKKIDAVAQRKSNKEQKLRSKEKHANKLAEKARRKKDHLKAVDDWAKSAASRRGGAMEDDDDAYLGRMKRGWTDRDGNLQSGPNKKRMAADRKYGHGGKSGRFKQTDRKSLNDMSGFNPRGNFSGGTKARGGSGANRQGKRARDAAKSRR